MEDNVSTNPMLRIIHIRNFRLLWIGGTVSMLGSQFSMIAMPWLVLQLTGDPLVLGFVLALASIPRALIIMIGGTASDRFSARSILLACDGLNFGLALLVAALVYLGMMQVWMLYFFSLSTGLLAGFVIPAANSIIPDLVPGRDLQAGNSITMGSTKVAGFFGPALAGIIIGMNSESALGIVVAFLVDGLTFAFSAAMLWMIHLTGPSPAAGHASRTPQRESIWQSNRIALVYLWSHAGLRLMFIITVATNFLFTGLLLVGIPVLADQRLPEGAQAFGFLMSAYAGGNLFGYLLAGVLPKLTGRVFSTVILVLLAFFGLTLTALGWITVTWVDFLLMFLLGTGNGYIAIVIFTWIQTRTPRVMMGRVMSILLRTSLGLVPLSQALAGALSRWSLSGLFAGAGGLLLVITAWVAFQPALRTLSEEMVGE